jgi:Flp pilus assembly protein TadG
VPRGPRRERWGDGEGGQAAVELVLALPLVAVLLLGVVQVGLVVRDQVLLVHAAREAVREAAVGGSPAAARAAALAGAPLDPARLRVAIRGDDPRSSRVVARLSYRVRTDVVLVGPLLPDVALEAHAAMRREQGDSG